MNYFGSLSKREIAVLTSLKDLQGLNLYNICKSLKLSESTIKLSVRKLISKGLLKRTDQGIFLTRSGNKVLSILMGSSSNVRTTVSKTVNRGSTKLFRKKLNQKAIGNPFDPTKEVFR